MRIVHFIFELEIGGAENMLVDIANEQGKTCDVAIVIIKETNNEQLLARLSKDVHIEVLSKKYNKYNPLFLLKLWQFLWRFKPAAIHCHHINCIPLLPFFLNKTVITIHNVNYNLAYVKLCKKVYAISEAVKQDIDNRLPIKSIIVSNGIHFKDFKQRTKFSKSAKETFKFIQVGRYITQKGQDILLRSIAQIVHEEKITNLSVDLVGYGKDEQMLKALASELKIDSYVNFLGPKDRKWVYENLSTYFALVQPSRFEGFGLTVIEAIAAKIPVIAFDIDGPTEILTGLPSCYLVPPLDTAGFTAAMLSAINNTDFLQLEKDCNKSYDLAMSKFSLENTAKKYVELYIQL